MHRTKLISTALQSPEQISIACSVGIDDRRVGENNLVVDDCPRGQCDFELSRFGTYCYHMADRIEHSES